MSCHGRWVESAALRFNTAGLTLILSKIVPLIRGRNGNMLGCQVIDSYDRAVFAGLIAQDVDSFVEKEKFVEIPKG